MKLTLISNPVDLLYLTKLNLSRGILFLSEIESRLFVDSRYFLEAQKKSPYPVSLWEKDAPFEWAKSLSVETVLFDSSTTSYDVYLSYQKFFPNLTAVSGICKEKRRIKTPHEIEILRKAAKLTLDGIYHVEKLLTLHITEKEIAWEFEKYVRERGASGLSFEPIIAFGLNSAFPHHRSTEKKLENDQIVLIDVGAIVDGYRGDLTRVHFFGNPNPELKTRLDLIKQASQKAIEAIKPKAKIKDLDEAAKSILRKANLETFFTHSLGHGIGLETHESPLIRVTGVDSELELVDGMVFTIEPGLYEEDLGGVRYENMVLVKNGHGVLLTC